MGYKITINLTNEEYEEIKKSYQKEKKNSPIDISFDEYLDKWISFAIKTQIQFSSFSDNLNNFSSSLLNNINFDNFKVNDKDMNDLSDFVNNLFNKKTNDEEKKDKTESNESNKKIN